ncbi:MAG: bifunctional hydroxymethylpyrimidine kinase/phosphomethylpyrimidine kinase, partial [Microbacterium sp.]
MTMNILSIAGTDPTGGAGIHADIKTFSAMGGYAMAAIGACPLFVDTLIPAFAGEA